MSGARGVHSALHCPSPGGEHADWFESNTGGGAGRGRAHLGCVCRPGRPSLTRRRKDKSVPAGIFLFLIYLEGDDGPFYLLSILSEKGSGFQFL